MGNAENIFNSLNNKSDLGRLIEEYSKEDLYVDFKSVYDPRSGEMTDGWKQNLGKGLSGFANSAGGILVFGVSEPESGKFILDPIDAITSFEHKVQEQISRLTSANVPGVETKKILNIGSEGYLLVMIPKSDIAPHQLMRDKKYYRRSGDSFLPMEHFELENMFGRAPKPILLPDIKIITSSSSGNNQINLSNTESNIL